MRRWIQRDQTGPDPLYSQTIKSTSRDLLLAADKRTDSSVFSCTSQAIPRDEYCSVTSSLNITSIGGTYALYPPLRPTSPPPSQTHSSDHRFTSTITGT